MVGAGAVAVSDDGRPVASAHLMRTALEYARTFGIPVADHCEEPTLAAGGAMNEGLVSARLGLDGLLGAFESLSTATTINDVLATLGEQLAAEFPRVALFRVKGNRLEGAHHLGEAHALLGPLKFERGRLHTLRPHFFGKRMIGFGPKLHREPINHCRIMLVVQEVVASALHKGCQRVFQPRGLPPRYQVPPLEAVAAPRPGFAREVSSVPVRQADPVLPAPGEPGNPHAD